METLLKKQISESDLARIRNLVTKKYGDSTKTQTGYKKSKEKHNEGDVWEENGKNWTLKNGIKTTISKLDIVKKSLHIPLCCPKCGNAMKKKQLDTKMYNIHKMCFDCVIDYETNLRRDGKYEQYVEEMMKGNMKTFVSDIKADLEEFLKEVNTPNNIVTESGEIEQWNSNSEKLKSDIQEYLNKLELM